MTLFSHELTLVIYCFMFNILGSRRAMDSCDGLCQRCVGVKLHDTDRDYDV